MSSIVNPATPSKDTPIKVEGVVYPFSVWLFTVLGVRYTLPYEFCELMDLLEYSDIISTPSRRINYYLKIFHIERSGHHKMYEPSNLSQRLIAPNRHLPIRQLPVVTFI
jgi:hypothetical protein